MQLSNLHGCPRVDAVAHYAVLLLLLLLLVCVRVCITTCAGPDLQRGRVTRDHADKAGRGHSSNARRHVCHKHSGAAAGHSGAGQAGKPREATSQKLATF